MGGMVGSRVLVVMVFCHVACLFTNEDTSYLTEDYAKDESSYEGITDIKDIWVQESKLRSYLEYDVDLMPSSTAQLSMPSSIHSRNASLSPSSLSSSISNSSSPSSSSLTPVQSSFPLVWSTSHSRRDAPSSSSSSSSLSSSSSSSSSSFPMSNGNHLIRRRSAQKTANVGGKVVMECELTVRDEKDYMIKWVKQGIEVPILIQVKKGTPPHIDSRYEGRIRVTNEANVELTKILLKDQGWYACTVMAINNSSDPGSTTSNNSTWVHLTVNAPPVFGSVSPGFLRVKEGTNLDLFCEATGRPEPSVLWTKDGKELVSDFKYRLHNDGNSSKLSLEKTTKDDSGQFSCLFQNSIAQVSHNIRVIVESNAYIVTRPRNTTVMEGNRVRMDCEADAHPKNLTYKWFKEGVDVHFVTGLMNRAGIHGDGSFVITHAKREDQGWYRCQPSNGIDTPPEASAYLNITYLPRVIKMEPSLYLPTGLPAKIDCFTDGNPPAKQIVWMKDEHQISDKNIRINKNGSLVLKQVRHSDQGQYACQPKSSLGEGQSSIPTQVFVKDPPHFTVRPLPIYQKFLGESVTMPCLAEGEPPPTISWRKVSGNETNKFKKPLSAHYQSIWHKHHENLSLFKLTKEDQGVYECVATSVVATVVTATILVVETSSRRRPSYVTVRTTNTTATVSWMPAYDSGHPHHYVLWYSKQDGEAESWTTLRIFQDNVSMIMIHDLKPSTTYRFMVFSRTTSGVGLFSKITAATTKGSFGNYRAVTLIIPISPKSYESMRTKHEDDEEDDESEESGSGGLMLGGPMLHRELRPSPPYNLSVTNTKNGMVISWLPPRSLVPVHHYSLLYKTMGQWSPLVDEYPNTSYTWKTPSFGVTYLFRVIAYSAQNVASESSRIFPFDTGDPMPPEKTKLSYSMPLIILGGMAVAIVILVVVIVAARWCRKRRQKASVRYGNVKYFGPNQADSIHRQTSRAVEALPVCSITEIEPVFMNENHTPSSNCFMHPPIVNDIKKIQETPI